LTQYRLILNGSGVCAALPAHLILLICRSHFIDIIFINTLLFQLLLRDFLRKKEASYREENFSNDEKMKEPMSNIPCYMVEAPKLLWNWWKKERKLRLKYDEGELKVSNLFKTTTLTWLVSLYV
jgi:hypothetical protein